MAFPTTGLLDAFTYGGVVQNLDVIAPSSWARGGPSASLGAFETTGDNRTRCGVSFTGVSIWIGSGGVMTDQEAYVELPVLSAGTDRQGLILRAREYSDTVVTIDGYLVCKQGTNLTVEKLTNGSASALASTPQTFAAGDSIGASVIGNQIQAYRKTGGVWSAVGAPVSDASYPNGRIGLFGRATLGIYDNLGGGPVVPVVTASFDFVTVF